MKTAADLAALTRQKTWDKDVVLWIGSENALLHTLGQISYAVLDLLDVFDEEHLPIFSRFRSAQRDVPCSS